MSAHVSLAAAAAGSEAIATDRTDSASFQNNVFILHSTEVGGRR